MKYTQKARRISWIILVVFAFSFALASDAQQADVVDGEIIGACVGWPTPHIEIRWSANPPSGSLPPSSNSILRDVNGAGNQWFFGGGAPGIYGTRIDGSIATPYGAGGYPNPNYGVYDLRDDFIANGATYTYKIKYRPETPSSNTYSVTVNAVNCSAAVSLTPSYQIPTPTPSPLSVSPSFQAVLPNVSAILTATGGNGSYVWSAPTGVVTGAGSAVSVLFTNDSSGFLYKTVTVQSGVQTATVTVEVGGVQTFHDDIVLLERGSRFVEMNDDAPITRSSDVMLTLSHGFVAEATTGITMKLGNSVASASMAVERPFQKTIPWNVCVGLSSCDDGMYTVYAMYRNSEGVLSPMTQDTIVYLKAPPEELPSLTINNGSKETVDRQVMLTLVHGLKGIPSDEITVQIANAKELLDGADAALYSSTIPDWDICFGIGATCANGSKTVYAKYCARGTCTVAVFDDIHMESLWPDWGVMINKDKDAASPAVGPAQLQLNPWFDVPGTEVFLSNVPDFSVYSTVSFTASLPWNLSVGHTVYVRYANYGKSLLWPGVQSPRYQDTVTSGAIACTPRPACLDAIRFPCKPPEPEGGWCPVITPTPAPTPTCVPRPACLDFARFACELPEPEEGWCIASTASPAPTSTPPPVTTSVPPNSVPSIAGAGAGAGGGSSIGSGVSSSVPTVSPPAPVFIQTLSEVSDVIEPISAVSAIAVSTSAVVALTPILGSAGSAAFLWQGLVGMLGLLPKRKKVWGTVYDSNTKRPIPFAKVQLMDHNKRVLETRIADKNGRYGFLTTPESLLVQRMEISIAPSAKNYLFPSHAAASVDTLVYNNLYYGDPITVSDQKLINYDIPMDPVRPSTVSLMMKSPSIVLGATVVALADAGFWLGLIMIPLNVIISPGPFSFGVMFLFLGTSSLRIWGISEHPFGTVVDGVTGHPVPFALITLNDLTGKRVGFTVTDERGRYFFVIDKGTYEMTLFTPASVIPMRQTKQIIDANKGWITKEIRL